LPWRFSTEPSIVRWKINGVVAEENGTTFVDVLSGSNFAAYCITSGCLGNTHTTDAKHGLTHLRDNGVQQPLTYRTESSVGINKAANLAPCPEDTATTVKQFSSAAIVHFCSCR